MNKLSIKIVLLMLFYSCWSYSQQPKSSELALTLDSSIAKFPTEKIYIQTDRPYYSNRDTIWLKAYILDASLSYTKESGLYHVELIDDKGKIILMQSMPIKLGIGFGQIALNANFFPEGNYTMRAYTNLMQNQGEESFFRKEIYISEVKNDAWLIHASTRTVSQNSDSTLDAELTIAKLDKSPVILQSLNLRVSNGSKLLSPSKVTTDFNGKIQVKIKMPKTNLSQINITTPNVKQSDVTHNLYVPITVNHPFNTDIQFMPEGGEIVSGLPCTIGFKAIGEDGKGMQVHGVIVNKKDSIVASFRSTHLGMGHFRIIASAGEKYTAKLFLPEHAVKEFQLPSVKSSGIVLHIINRMEQDSIKINIYTSNDLKSKNNFSLIGCANGKVCYAARLSFSDGMINGAISKTKFPSGIVHFVLFDNADHAIAERQIFIDHSDFLKLSVYTDRTLIHANDSVTLHIVLKDKDNHPVQGSLSMAITDNSVVEQDSTNSENIKSYILLISNLKGTIEQPGYYFDPKNTDRYEVLDDLLLTQGWVNYKWQSILNQNYHPLFLAEDAMSVSGYISRTGGKDVQALPISLRTLKKPFMIRDTITDAKGNFVFKNLPHIDTPDYIIEVNDKKAKMFEAMVNVNLFIPSKVTIQDKSQIRPWYVNTNNTYLNYMNNSIAYKSIEDSLRFPKGTRVLQDVKVKGIRLINGSHFYAGYGAVPDQVLSEEDMKKATNTTLEEILKKYVKGFYTSPFPCNGMPGSQEYVIFCKPIQLSIDGFFVDYNYVPHDGFTDHWAYIKNFLTFITAQSIKGIEIKDSYVEVTTYNGNGAFMNREVGKYAYRPLPVSWPVRFYVPKYNIKAANNLTDLSSTLFWAPNIITDTEGKATISFYTKKQTTNYDIVVEGSNLSGNIGELRTTIHTVN